MKAITQAEFETEVLGSAIPVLVDFYTDRCTPCVRLTPVLEALAQEQAGRWKMVKVNAQEEAELAARFRISAVPTLLAFRDGRCVAQRVGQGTGPQILEWLREA